MVHLPPPTESQPLDGTSSPARLLTLASGLLALACGPTLATAATFADLLTKSSADWIEFTAAAVAYGWLAWLTTRRSLHTSERQRRSLYILFALGGFAYLYTTSPASSGTAQGLGDLTYGVALAWLAWEVCRTSGPRLRTGFGLADDQQRRTTWNVTSLAYLACLLGMFLYSGIRRPLAGSDSVLAGIDQDTALGMPSLAGRMLLYTASALIEEVVVIASVSTLLAAARRPAWQIYGTVVLVETALHAYMGVAAVAMGAWAAGHVWLYRRYAAVAPLLVAHLAHSATVLFRGGLPAPYGTLASSLLVIVAVLGTRQRPVPPGSRKPVRHPSPRP